MIETENIKSKEEALAIAADLLRDLNKLENKYHGKADFSPEAAQYQQMNDAFDSLLKKFDIRYSEVHAIRSEDEDKKEAREAGQLFEELRVNGIDSEKLSRLKELCQKRETTHQEIWVLISKFIHRDRDRYEPEEYQTYLKNVLEITKTVFGDERHGNILASIERYQRWNNTQ